MNHRNITKQLLLIFFLSGMSCLICEMVWSRYLHLLFGTSTFALAAVVATFMIGLALGNFIFGKLADKTTKLIRLLSWIQLGIALYVFLSPLIFMLLTQTNKLIFQSIDAGPILKNSLRFLLSFLFLAVPAILMGANFPVVIRLFNRDVHQVGQDSGRLYAVNTAGGVVGVGLSGFFLVRLLGLQNTLFLAGFVNLLCLFIILTIRSSQPQKTDPACEDTTKAQRLSSDKYLFFLMATYFLIGFTSLSLEIIWTKILTLFFRDSIYDFTIVLTVFLTGIFAGSYVSSKTLLKLRNVQFVFAIVMVLSGLSSLGCIYFISQLPYVATFLQSMPGLYEQYQDQYWLLGTAFRYGYAFLIMLVPTMLFGALFPLLTKMIILDRKKIATKIGLLNGMNTAGSALGSLLTGFVFIPLIGLNQSMILMAVLNLIFGILAALFVPLKNKKLKPVFITCLAAGSLLVCLFIPRWDKLHMSTYILEIGQPLHDLFELEYYNEDAYGITSVVELIPTKRKYLTTNRLFTQNSSITGGWQDHRRLGHIPMLLHPNPQDVLVVGLGAGITVRGVKSYPAKSIDVAEISKSVVAAARYFSTQNDNIHNDNRVEFIIEDGRNYITTSSKKYDVIIADIFFPMSSGSSNLYTEEYYRLCKERLNLQGLMVQWLPAHQLSLEEIKIISHTFQSVFPNTTLWVGMVGENLPVVGCIGTHGPLQIDFKRLKEKFTVPTLQNELESIAIPNPVSLLSNFIMDSDQLSKFTKNSRLNQDQHPIIEFTNPLLHSRFQKRGDRNMEELIKWREEIFDKDIIN